MVTARWLGYRIKFCRFEFLLCTTFNGNIQVRWNNIFVVHCNGELILFSDVVYFCFTHHVTAMYIFYYGLGKQPFIY